MSGSFQFPLRVTDGPVTGLARQTISSPQKHKHTRRHTFKHAARSSHIQYSTAQSDLNPAAPEHIHAQSQGPEHKTDFTLFVSLYFKISRKKNLIVLLTFNFACIQN